MHFPNARDNAVQLVDVGFGIGRLREVEVGMEGQHRREIGDALESCVGHSIEAGAHRHRRIGADEAHVAHFVGQVVGLRSRDADVVDEEFGARSARLQQVGTMGLEAGHLQEIEHRAVGSVEAYDARTFAKRFLQLCM